MSAAAPAANAALAVTVASLTGALTPGAFPHELLGAAAAAARTAGPLALGVAPAEAAGSLTAAVGLFVAYQAYRGYRRNDSRPMLFLGIGIFLVTAVSFVVSTLLVGALGASDAEALVAWTALEIAGLGSILYALTGA